MRCETEKKWGDETQDKKRGRNDARQKKQTMVRQDARQKKNGETRYKTKKNGETRHKTIKMGRRDVR